MRARNIKPGLFKNEVLGMCDPIHSLLFVGLWCLADREGKLEDRPARIKAEIFPYRESLDIHRYLTDLQRWGFIVRYKSGELGIISICNFLKHQSPHHTEKRSILPDVENSDGCVLTVDSPLTDGEYPPDSLIPDSLIHRISPAEPEARKSRKPREKKPTTGPSIAEILKTDGTPDGDRLHDRYWITARFWDTTKNPKPREAAIEYRKLYDAKQNLREVADGASAYRASFLPPNRQKDETQYMIGFLEWLKQEGWQNYIEREAM